MKKIKVITAIKLLVLLVMMSQNCFLIHFTFVL